jgi:hypothetical protein
MVYKGKNMSDDDHIIYDDSDGNYGNEPISKDYYDMLERNRKEREIEREGSSFEPWD